jgi:peptidoglycan/xylan/chitin deacetylase (PgdA/CDA1 family)
MTDAPMVSGKFPVPNTGPGFAARRVAHASMIAALGLFVVAAPGPGAAQQTAPERPHEPASAVVIMYHRFGAHTFPSTNIRIDQSEAHLEELAIGKYTVRPVGDIVNALKAGRPLPDRTIGLTIDDAFLSVYRQAWPRLRKAGLPFTLFVATDAIDRGGKDYMNWDQVREMARAGVTIGAHSASHGHLPTMSARAIKGEIARSNKRFEKELGFKPQLFAYPYGEAGRAVVAAVRPAGYTASFSQYSGVLHGKSDFFYLPRFAMNEHYGSLRRFRMAANALALHATDFTGFRLHRWQGNSRAFSACLLFLGAREIGGPAPRPTAYRGPHAPSPQTGPVADQLYPAGRRGTLALARVPILRDKKMSPHQGLIHTGRG